MTPSPDPSHDVAAILEALRAEVRAQWAQRANEEADPALSAIERELRHAAEQLEITRVVSAHWPLEGRTLYERAWILVHKVVRRGLRWYINPIVEQQNAFNDSAARALRLLIESHAELRARIANLERQQAPLISAGGATPASGSEASAPAPPSPANLSGLIEQLERRRTISAHWHLRGAGLPGQARTLAQRAIRQYLRWLINPIVEQQNACNEALAGAMPHLAAAEATLRARLEAVERVRGAAGGRNAVQPQGPM
ncbi:MAG: hypothetical protein RMK84_18820 [Oscillochloridaceae bacterium]|nr:hypothetical protein [Chloroflexaceae bacterium]MDW8392178.1 hypothetical protein [Oscillochloridaceae bacterium]